MSDKPQYAKTEFGDIVHNSLVTSTAKENREAKLSLSVFKGNASFSVNIGTGGSPWRQGLTAPYRIAIAAVLREIRKQPNTCRQTIGVKAFEKDPQTGRLSPKPTGTITIGIDDQMTLFIELAFNTLNGGQRLTFPIKIPGTLDMSETSLTERDLICICIDYVIDGLITQAGLGVRLSSVRSQRPGGGGGNWGGNNGGGQRQGGWNGGNSGGGSSGGGNNGGGGAASDDDDGIAF